MSMRSLSDQTPGIPFSCSTSLLLGKRCHPQIWFDDLEIGEQLFRLLVFDGWVHDHIITRNPVDRSRNFVLVSCL
jgi:hypothetical protein